MTNNTTNRVTKKVIKIIQRNNHTSQRCLQHFQFLNIEKYSYRFPGKREQKYSTLPLVFKHEKTFKPYHSDFIFIRNKAYLIESTVWMAEGVKTIFVKKFLVFSQDASPFVQTLAVEGQILAGWGPRSFVLLQVLCW